MAIKLDEYRENLNNTKEYAIKGINLSLNQTDKEKEIDKADDEYAKKNFLFIIIQLNIMVVIQMNRWK